MSIHANQRCDHQRVIIHIDFDCYYAQVEMVKNPEIRDKPVGVRQETIVVTCNYLAREKGVKKLMPLKTAQELCPDIVIVPGEDLDDYRTVSYKVSRHLQTLFPLVERLGIDENFVDATDEVDKRLQGHGSDTFHPIGHLISRNVSQTSDELIDDCTGDCHRRLNLGSAIAQEIRESILSTFELTCSAGVAHNKLLAKMVGSTHKPNQQSVLYPEQALPFLHTLTSVSKIPGIGPSKCQKLASHAIETISQLQECSISDLDGILGRGAGLTVLNLSRGIDNSPVVPFGKPLSFGLEGSVSKGTTFHDCECKIRQMVDKLMARLMEDGRIPHTVRMIVRKGSGTRESRQCPLPLEVYQGAKSNPEKQFEKIVSLFVSLFTKMIASSSSSQVTLIGVTFTKLTEPEKTSIQKYFKRPSTSELTDTPCNKKQLVYCETDQIANCSSDSDAIHQAHRNNVLDNLESHKDNISFKTTLCNSIPSNVDDIVHCDSDHNNVSGNTQHAVQHDNAACSVDEIEQHNVVPSGVDSEVFNQLPKELKDELLDEWSKANTSAKPKSVQCTEKIPHNIDPDIFMELPDEIKTELRRKWQKEEPNKKGATANTIMKYFSKR